MVSRNCKKSDEKLFNKRLNRSATKSGSKLHLTSEEKKFYDECFRIDNPPKAKRK